MASRSGLKAFLKLSFYEVLGVSEDADAEELKKAYHQKALEHHPDKNLEDANANARFTRVNEAFETLRDKDRRANYDLSRTAQSPPPTGASTGFAYRAPPNRPSNAGEQQRGHYTSPSNDPAHSWLMPLYAFLSIMAILVGELIGFFTSGSRLPSPISRFNPSRLARLYPGPVRERSATIQDILAFLQALSKNGPLSLEPGPMNWFSVYADFFECIAIEEKFHGSTILSTPRLGDFLTPRNEIDLFYRFWRNFETVKDFTWMSFHQVPPAHLATPLGRAQAEYENHMGRQFRKQEFEGLIRVIAEKLQEGDPRLRSYQRPFARPKNASKAPKGKGNGNNKKKAKKRRR